ncbi:hypothetical protein H5P28_10010 [Ruficoccus amylovorans]|uniref:Uncharacterized protein n=1 Tax=Ruficoccus amylovorans TaxID=1804625 RepID=A0A842HDK3_9BACT|nr:hypothetical protein [Ruficoccus amylovorans]MBC2594593.1 hypothetical protein [Ruficoccus amylovorans]
MKFRTSLNEALSVLLLFLGVIWLFFAYVLPLNVESNASSSVSYFEYKLAGWIQSKVVQGKLTEADVAEILDEQWHIKVEDGGRRYLHALVYYICESSRPPLWPGWLACVVGFVGGAISRRRICADRAAANTKRK